MAKFIGDFALLPEPLRENEFHCAECGAVFVRESKNASRQKWCEACSNQRKKESRKRYYERCMADPVKRAKMQEADRVRKKLEYHRKKGLVS